MTRLEKMYMKMPWFIQHLMIQMQGMRLKKLRFGKSFHKDFALLQELRGKSYEEQRLYTALKLKEALVNAQKSPFWNKRFVQNGVDVQGENIFDELAKLPLLSKKDVQENRDLITITGGHKKLVYLQTGGTTGTSLRLPNTRSMISKQWAVWWRCRYDLGLTLDSWCGWFGGKLILPKETIKPPFWRVNYPGKQLMFSALHLSEKTAPLYYQELSKRKIPWLHGYPSQIALLAYYFKRLHLEPWKALKIVTIGSEKLYDSQKELMQEVFRVPVRQHYGLTEGAANICENSNGQLICDDDFCYTEFEHLHEGSDLYKIIGSNFSNHAFPLFRYDTGDLARINTEGEKTVVLSIEGRNEDYLIMPDGNRLGPFNLIAKEFSKVKEAQLVQMKTGDLTLKIVKAEGFSKKDEINALEKVQDRLTCEVKLQVKFVDFIERTKSGKFRAVIAYKE